MKKMIWNVQALGIGVLTPALTGHPQAAAARSVDPVEDVQNHPEVIAGQQYEAAKAVMITSVYDLTTAEKLRVAGARVASLAVNSRQLDQGVGIAREPLIRLARTDAGTGCFICRRAPRRVNRSKGT